MVCSIEKLQDIVCNGEDNGSAEVSVEGGSLPLTYLWINGETTALATALEPGVNTVTITDNDGCMTNCEIEISEPALLSCTITKLEDVNCNGQSDGSAEVMVLGGVPNSDATSLYTYSWDNGETTQIALGLSAGTHEVTVTDDNGCTTTCTVEIVEPEVLSCSLTKVDIECNGDQTGSITVSALGGSVPYEYSINGSVYQPGNEFNNLPSGTHIITCLLYTSPSPRDKRQSRMPSSA